MAPATRAVPGSSKLRARERICVMLYREVSRSQARGPCNASTSVKMPLSRMSFGIGVDDLNDIHAVNRGAPAAYKASLSIEIASGPFRTWAESYKNNSYEKVGRRQCMAMNKSIYCV